MVQEAAARPAVLTGEKREDVGRSDRDTERQIERPEPLLEEDVEDSRREHAPHGASFDDERDTTGGLPHGPVFLTKGGAAVNRVYTRKVRRERGLIVIIAYKLVKGGLWLILAVVLMVLMRMGFDGELLGLAEALRHHALADLVVRAASRRALWTIVVALVADGAMSLLEGWALLHGRWWGPWLVVVATGSLLPFEVVALVKHVRPVRAALLAVNVVIVVYLARKAARERRT